MDYQELLENRKKTVDGIEDWLWIKDDTGAWTGPAEDWENSHRDKFRKYVKNFRTVICAGGNCGMYPRLFAKYFHTVYTFEPDPLNFHCLVNNCQLDNVVKIQGALGLVNGLVSIERGHMTNVGEHKIGSQTGVIPMFALDSFRFHSVDLIQLDVESFEIDAIKGAVNTINRFKPVVSAENGHMVVDIMKQLNYDFIERSVADFIFLPR
jgi:FkbM family methyltransferase